MRFAITHDVQRGIRRLLAAPRDLLGSAPWTDPPIARDQASARHRDAYARYLEQLEWALEVAERWWSGTLQQLLNQGIKRDKALARAYRAHFAGPAAAPEIVWVLRTFWLECVAINAETPEPERVPPEVFLLHWLVEDQRSDAVAVLTGMPYWPIGLDADGNWT